MSGPRPGPLFGGRERKPPPATEFATHCALADTIKLSISPGWTWWHTPNGSERSAFVNAKGKRVSPEGERLRRMGVLPGVSDFLFIAPSDGARLMALELKRKGQKPTDAQLNFMARITAAGGVAEWVDSYEAAVAVLKRWGAVKVAL